MAATGNPATRKAAVIGQIDQIGLWPYNKDMAIPMIKGTYSLDVETVRDLEQMASHWGVSKSEALRRAIRAMAQTLQSVTSPLDALDELQRSLNLSPAKTQAWSRRVRTERRASSLRREEPKR